MKPILDKAQAYLPPVISLVLLLILLLSETISSVQAQPEFNGSSSPFITPQPLEPERNVFRVNDLLGKTASQRFFEEGRCLCERETQLLLNTEGSSTDNILKISEDLFRQEQLPMEQNPQTSPSNSK
ncbi:hypothetical protein [Lyngbya aestuarii]|uniref:hypothetical protein n=1 Tax=Lyngbya aestuarii TaxID=118322 RepID=UPI00403DAFA4